MQFDEKVLTALEVLTDAAENDFELFRICTLVRDLIAPPVAEQVDDTHQRFDGVTYTLHRNHYEATDAIHKAVWRYYHGDIPQGKGAGRYEIHHDDWDPANNAVHNLVLKTSTEHRAIHSQNPPESVAHVRVQDNICEICGKHFKPGRNQKYCSKKCRDKGNRDARRVTPLYRICKNCGKEFFVDHPAKLYCSHECAHEYNIKRYKKFTKICPVCGKEFQTRTEKSKYCSFECYRTSTIKKSND